MFKRTFQLCTLTHLWTDYPHALNIAFLSPAAAVQSMKEILTNVCEQVKSLTESKARQVSNTGYTQLRPSSAISTAQHREPNTDNGIYHVM